jgi:hypothetical protein
MSNVRTSEITPGKRVKKEREKLLLRHSGDLLDDSLVNKVFIMDDKKLGSQRRFDAPVAGHPQEQCVFQSQKYIVGVF